jgi:hypothetical protein
MLKVAGVDDAAFSQNGTPGLLDDYRVDLFKRIKQGIPEPEFVPGCDGFVRKGKRHLVPASAGTGKSLAWLRIAVDSVQKGGTVVILDLENGGDEYAARLECILDACGELTADQEERLRYYEWPRLSLTWKAEEWVAAVAGANMVIFDSSRLALSQVGLDENSANDYAEFIDAILLPLAKAGIATVLLDNTGHSESRARGSKAKEDLNEVVFEMSARGTIDLDTTGTLTFKLTRTRFAGLHRRLEMKVGGGVYEMPQPVEDSFDDQGNWRPTVLMQRIADYLKQHPGAGSRDVRENVQGKAAYLLPALQQLVKEGYVESRHRGDGRLTEHHLIRPFLG